MRCSSGQLSPPPALPGLRPGRTCRMGALHPTGVASHPLPDLLGEMRPAWGGVMCPGPLLCFWHLLASRARWGGVGLVAWSTSLLALSRRPGLNTLCVSPADDPRLAPPCVLLGCLLGFAQWGGRVPGHLPPAGWGPGGRSSSWCQMQLLQQSPSQGRYPSLTPFCPQPAL